MRLILTNGRMFTIKIKHDKIPMSSCHKDEYGRTVETYWNEHKTKVTIEEFFPDNDKVSTNTTYTGYSYCSYKDHYSKKVGRELAFYNAVSEMLKRNVISSNESVEFDNFSLNTWIQDNRKTNLKKKVINDSRTK